jgi:urea transport system permease protein
MIDVAGQLLTGLSIAAILLMVALGLAVIYGVTGVINLAHGEFVMLGAYAAWFAQSFLGLGLIESLPLVFLAVGLLGLAIERSVIRWLYSRPLDTILATWGIGVVFQQLIRLSAGGELRYVATPPSLEHSVVLLGVSISAYRAFVLIVALAAFAATWLLIFRTTLGLQLRAVTQNREVAESFGVNAGRVYASVFAFGAALAGLAGALVAPLKSVAPEMGTTYVVEAFMVVVLGGVQSLFGTVASSALLGELTAFIAYVSNDTIAKALVLLAVVIMIRSRPRGLFTKAARA